MWLKMLHEIMRWNTTNECWIGFGAFLVNLWGYLGLTKVSKPRPEHIRFMLWNGHVFSIQIVLHPKCVSLCDSFLKISNRSLYLPRAYQVKTLSSNELWPMNMYLWILFVMSSIQKNQPHAFNFSINTIIIIEKFASLRWVISKYCYLHWQRWLND